MSRKTCLESTSTLSFSLRMRAIRSRWLKVTTDSEESHIGLIFGHFHRNNHVCCSFTASNQGTKSPSGHYSHNFASIFFSDSCWWCYLDLRLHVSTCTGFLGKQTYFCPCDNVCRDRHRIPGTGTTSVIPVKVNMSYWFYGGWMVVMSKTCHRSSLVGFQTM